MKKRNRLTRNLVLWPFFVLLLLFPISVLASDSRPCERFELPESGQYIFFGNCDNYLKSVSTMPIRFTVHQKREHDPNHENEMLDCQRFEMNESGQILVFGNCIEP